MKLKWGVIGAGGIADRRTLPGMMLADNADLIAVMEINQEMAEKLRTKYSAKRAYDNIDSLLADPEIEAVYIASPVSSHKEQAIKAARAKKHILIEKPLAFSIEDGEEVLKVAKENNVIIAAGFMMRFHSFHQQMKEIVQSGGIGEVVSCRGQLTCWYPDIDGAWRQKFALSGGGAMMDMGVHCIDLIQFITGYKAKKVTGFSGNKTFRYEVEDSASLIMELENGAYAYVDSNFNIPDAAARCRLEIYGTKGSLLAEGTIAQVEGGSVQTFFSDDSLGYSSVQNRGTEKSGDLIAEFGNMYTKEIESFGNSVISGKPPEVPADDALQVQKVVNKFYEAARLGIIKSL